MTYALFYNIDQTTCNQKVMSRDSKPGNKWVAMTYMHVMRLLMKPIKYIRHKNKICLEKTWLRFQLIVPDMENLPPTPPK